MTERIWPTGGGEPRHRCTRYAGEAEPAAVMRCPQCGHYMRRLTDEQPWRCVMCGWPD